MFANLGKGLLLDASRVVAILDLTKLDDYDRGRFDELRPGTKTLVQTDSNAVFQSPLKAKVVERRIKEAIERERDEITRWQGTA